jgi:hypothetical protein
VADDFIDRLIVEYPQKCEDDLGLHRLALTRILDQLSYEATRLFGARIYHFEKEPHNLAVALGWAKFMPLSLESETATYILSLTDAGVDVVDAYRQNRGLPTIEKQCELKMDVRSRWPVMLPV